MQLPKRFLLSIMFLVSISTPVVAANFGAKIYKDPNFNQQMPAGPYPVSNGYIEEGYYDIQEFENDVISSVDLTTGYAIELFEHKNFTGKTWIYTEKAGYLGVADNKASSFRVFKTSPDRVTLYVDSEFRSYSTELPLQDLAYFAPDWNNVISSMKIPNGWLVVLYEHPNFQGRSKVFYGSTSYVGDDFNDTARSLRIINNLGIGNWGEFTKKCVYTEKGGSYLEYQSRLWNIPQHTGNEACENKGAWIEGQWRVRPTGCTRDTNLESTFTILSALGIFIPFIPTQQIVGGVINASTASIASASVTFAKDSIKTFGTGRELYGRYLIRNDSQCNVLYNQYSGTCLNYNNWDRRLQFVGCSGSHENQFLRRGELLMLSSGHWNHDFGSKDPGSDMCLDSNEQGQVYVHKCNGGNYQNWELIDAGVPDGAARYKNRQTGLCLDGDGYSVYTHKCHSEIFQQWK